MTTMSPTIGNIGLALSKLQGKIGLIPKSKTANVPTKNGGAYRYSYADLADICDALAEHLQMNELAITQIFTYEEGKCFLKSMLIHSSGEWISSKLEVDSHEKIQELGSEITYLRRYGVSSLLGIAADEDEDGALANTGAKKPKPAAKPLPQKEPCISPDQVKLIRDMTSEIQDVRRDIFKFAGVNTSQDIPASKFDQIMQMIEIRIRQEAGKPVEMEAYA